jgi:hypothetical protein
MNLTRKDQLDLQHAKNILENPSFLATVMNAIGLPIEKGIEMLPEDWQQAITVTTRKSLQQALSVSLASLDYQAASPSWDLMHKAMVAVTGAVGGAFGLPGLAVELPISTCVMLRSVADIARSHGERLDTVDARFACIEVFALGGRSTSDDGVESAYFAIRSALAKAVSDAAAYFTEKGVIQEGIPVLIRLVNEIAVRFEINVSEKLAAQAVPVVGAAGGAIVNTLFIDHFQDMAHGHFTVRRLERMYSPEFIRSEYNKL